MEQEHQLATKTAQKEPSKEPASSFSLQPELAERATMHPMLRLQRAVGNQAVQNIVHGRAPRQPLGASTHAFIEPRFGQDFSRIPTSTSTAGVIQTKLAINKPGDGYEQEADQIADQVLAAPANLTASATPPRIQRFTGQAPEPMDTAPTSVDHVLASSGRPLDPALRQDMEQRFGHDFSQVRVHSSSAAEQSAREVNANAFAMGHNIVFGAGQFAPGTHQGRRLIAHELTHVVQQGGGRENGRGVPGLQREILPEWVHKIAQMVGGSWYSNPRNKQFIDDLTASAQESPQHFGEFFEDELLVSIKEHLVRIVLVIVGLFLAEAIISALTAAPEPTMLTKVIAVILQILVIAILGYFAIVEVKGAYDEGRNWFATAQRANGDPAVLTEASRSFVRMLWHILMTILTIAGLRAKIRGFKLPKGAAIGEGEAGIVRGTLTPTERAELQQIANKYKTQIDIVGSRAQGAGRNIETDLPVGKGPGTRSDIDVRISGEADIASGGRLSNDIANVSGGAGKVISSTLPEGPSSPPVIIITPQ